MMLWLTFALAFARAAFAAPFRVVSVQLSEQQGLVLLGQADGVHRFSAAHAHLRAQGRTVLALTNAGIFHSPSDPVGLQIEAGQEVSPLNTDAGAGNFFLAPNGVFYLDSRGAHTVTTAAYAAAPPEGVVLATQSGPMLLIDGQVHPNFNPDSTSRKVRSGICAATPDRVHVFLSTEPVQFYETAVYARDVLKCRDALYLDGVISQLWTPARKGFPKRQYAGILGVWSKTD